jgi:inosose dehydratase
MKIRFGIAPIAWTNSDPPQLGGNSSLEIRLSESKQAGFSGTETGVKFPADAAKLADVLRRFGLKPVAGWFCGELPARSLEEEKRRKF